MLRGSVVTLLYRITGTGFGLLATVITARALTKSDLGTYVALIVVVQAIGTVAASFASASGYFVSKQGRPEAEVAANGLVLSMLVGLSLLVFCLAAAALYHGDARGAVVLVGLALPPIIARTALGGVSLGTSSLWRYNFSIHGPAYVNVFLLLGWVLLVDRHTAGGATVTWIAAQYISLVVTMAMTRQWWGWLRQHRPDPALMKGLVSFGAVIGVAGFISYFNYRVDQLLVISLDSRAGAGVYSRAVTLAEALWLVSTSIAIAGYASVGSLSRREAGILTSRGVRHTLVIVTLGAVALFVLAPYLIRFLYGDDFSGATTSLRILCVGTALFAPQAILANYFTVQMGRPSLSMIVAATSCLINIVVSVILIPRVGYVGGAWATTISYGSVAALSIGIFLANSDQRFSDLWRIRGDDVDTYVRAARRLIAHRQIESPSHSPGNGA